MCVCVRYVRASQNSQTGSLCALFPSFSTLIAAIDSPLLHLLLQTRDFDFLNVRFTLKLVWKIIVRPHARSWYVSLSWQPWQTGRSSKSNSAAQRNVFLSRPNTNQWREQRGIERSAISFSSFSLTFTIFQKGRGRNRKARSVCFCRQARMWHQRRD